MVRSWFRALPLLVAACTGSGAPKPPADLAVRPRTLSFAASQLIAVKGAAMVSGDLNGDGKPDLVVSEPTALHAVLNGGGGSFASTAIDSAGTDLSAPALGDFDGDGKLDVAITHRMAAKVGVLLGNGDGSFRAAKDSPTSEPNAWSVTAGDLNHDGKLDLIAPISSPSMTVDALLGVGDGTFQTAKTWQAGADPEYAALADLDGDGKLDAIVTNWIGKGVSAALGSGDGTFKSATTTAGAQRGVVATDLNGDGRPDVVAGAEMRGVAVFLNDGHGALKPAVAFSTGFVTFNVAVADFNGDGKPDVVAYGGAQLAFLAGDGAGAFGSPTTVAVAMLSNIDSGQIAVADFDGDGLPDVAALAVDGIHLLRNTSQ
jgi:hypothetical protein